MNHHESCTITAVWALLLESLLLIHRERVTYSTFYTDCVTDTVKQSFIYLMKTAS